MAKSDMKKALEEEVLVPFINKDCKGDFEKWKKGEKIESVRIIVLFDMGWNKRSSGTGYASTSGHALLVGAQFKKVIGHQVFYGMQYLQRS